MELTRAFLDLLPYFAPVFTQPTFQTFLHICNGWILSHRHRYSTDSIFSSGNIRHGHWTRFHRFFSDAAWSFAVLNLYLAWLVVRCLCPSGTLLWAVADTLCRKRGLTSYGTGLHHDPLRSSRAKPLVRWGPDWVVLCIRLVRPWWAPTQVFALPIAERLYRHRQGLTKGKKKKAAANTKQTKAAANQRTRPQLAVELLALAAAWFPDRDSVVTGDSADGGQSVLSHLPKHVQLISHVHGKGARYAPPPAPTKGRRGAPRKKGERRPGMTAWANDTSQPWRQLKFEQFGLHATLQVKSQPALYYQAGGSRLLTIVLVHATLGKRPDQMFYGTKLDGSVRQILSTDAARWAIECTFENCKQFLGLEDPANRVRWAVQRTAPLALFLDSLIVVWFQKVGHAGLQFPDRPWYQHQQEPSLADLLTTLRQVSYEEKTATLPLTRDCAKSWLARLSQLLSRTG